MPFLDDIKDRLVAQGVGVYGTNIFLSSAVTLPVGPGPYLSLTDTGGTAPTRVHNYASAATQRPTAQVLVRAKTYAAALAMARAAYLALDGIFNTTIGSTFYLSVTARQEPTDIGKDAADRLMLSFNIDAEKAA